MTPSEFDTLTTWMLIPWVHIEIVHVAEHIVCGFVCPCRKMKWTETKKLPLKIHGHCVVSENGLVYSIGGKTDEK